MNRFPNTLAAFIATVWLFYAWSVCPAGRIREDANLIILRTRAPFEQVDVECDWADAVNIAWSSMSVPEC